MTERDTGTRQHRRTRTAARIAAALLLAMAVIAVAGLATGRAAAVYRYMTSDPVTIEIEYVGIACGSHLRWKAPRDGLAAGTRIRFVNTTAYWHVPVEIATANRSDAAVLVTSPALPPGGEWEHVFWQSGDYFLRSAETMQQQAGLAGWVTVP